MTKNKVLNFIMKQIQWGIVKENDKFYSEKALAIKFNVSHSTSKNALSSAETLGLLTPLKGKGRIVNDFSKKLFVTNHISTDPSNLKIVKKFKKDFSSKEIVQIKKLSGNKKKKHELVMDVFYKKIKVATLFSFTYDINLFNSFKKDSNSFLDSLRVSNQLISKIIKTTFIEDGSPIIRRLLWNIDGKLIEEAYIRIEKQFFILEEELEFPFVYHS